MLRTAFSTTALALVLPAQPIVSPLGYDGSEGSSQNTFPWNNATFHYMQIHGDLPRQPRVMFRMSFRRDTSLGQTAATARTITLELFAGLANHATVSPTFANNWIAAPTRIVASRAISAPDWLPVPRSVPAPFDFTIPFDMPHVHPGTSDLGWEMLVTANTATAPYYADAATGTGGTSQMGGWRMNGTGCTTARGEFALRSNFTTTPAVMNVAWTASGGPPGASAGVLVGANDPDLPVPGLCGGRLRSDAGLLALATTLPATGTWTSPVLSVPYNPTLAGFTLYAQGVAADPTQPVFPFIATNGLASTVVDLAPPVRCSRIYLAGSLGPVGTVASNYVLVTWFNV